MVSYYSIKAIGSIIMKILVLNYEYWPIGGGGASVCKEICEKAVKAGHEVTVITMAFKGLKNEEIINGVDVHRISCIRKEARVCHPWEQLSYCINAYNYISNNIDMEKYDLLHCHFIVPTGLLSLWLKNKYKCKVIMTAHGSDVIGHNNSRFGLMYKFIKPFWKKIAYSADTLTSPSKHLADKIRNIIPDKEVKVIHNGLYLENYKALEKEKTILILSRLQESKGIQDIITACEGMDLNGWKIKIYGEGPYLNTLKQMVKCNKLENTISFCGFVSGEEKMKALGRAGVYFTGSRFEAFSVSLLEAMASGCELIVSNIGAHNELIKDEKIKYCEVDELKKIIQKVTSCEPQKKEYDLIKYDWTNVYREYDELYRYYDN